ncbi:MAG: hypothetical protein EOP84_25575 [Verrucomicrobiaceae bacterium]|nr:MAG: hypothetical protein EOP84_25575 [Verrucomicrobiaceae bacterium]
MKKFLIGTTKLFLALILAGIALAGLYELYNNHQWSERQRVERETYEKKARGFALKDWGYYEVPGLDVTFGWKSRWHEGRMNGLISVDPTTKVPEKTSGRLYLLLRDSDGFVTFTYDVSNIRTVPVTEDGKLVLQGEVYSSKELSEDDYLRLNSWEIYWERTPPKNMEPIEH